MRNVYVLGTGMIKFGRYPEKTVPELGAEAALSALNDAGINIQDVELFASGNLYQANAMIVRTYSSSIHILFARNRNSAGCAYSSGSTSAGRSRSCTPAFR